MDSTENINNSESENEELLIPDHDTYWKKIITYFFKDFVSYYFPKLHKKIDWEIPVVFLEQEFHKLVATRFKGKQIVDKLAKVTLKGGKQSFVILHAEAQSTWEKNFLRRMFTYYYLIDNKYPEEQYQITALAIYTGKYIPKQHDTYKRSFEGTELSFKFNTCVVKNLLEKDLVASQNPIALVLLAAKYEHESKNQNEERFAFKKKLVNLLYERNYEEEQIRILFQFIRYVVTLPQQLELNFNSFFFNKIKTVTMENKTAYLASKVSPHNKKWINDLYFSMFGETTEELVKRERAAAIEKTAKALKAAKAEAAKAKTEAAVAKELAEKTAREVAEKTAKEAVQVKISMVKKLLQAQSFTNTYIATLTDLPIETVEEIAKTMDS